MIDDDFIDAMTAGPRLTGLALYHEWRALFYPAVEARRRALADEQTTAWEGVTHDRERHEAKQRRTA